jgi:hypothetical protein
VGAALLALILTAPALAQEDTEQPPPADAAAPTDMGAPAVDTVAPDPTATPAPTAVVAVPTPAPGQVILSDNFTDPSNGYLPVSADSANVIATPPLSYSVGYLSGEYEMKKIDASRAASGRVELTGSYPNVSIDVDARLIDPKPTTSFWLTCRHQSLEGVATYYEAEAWPDDRTFNLWRGNSTETSNQGSALVRRKVSDKLLRSPATNHFQLTCAGNTIAFAINGATVASVQDAAYSDGALRIGTSAPAGAADTLRLANLVVTQR